MHTRPHPSPENPAAPPETRASLPMALLRAREAVMARFRPLLAEYGINEQQWRVIRVLAESGRLDATELAARANILAPSLTRMLKALEARTLILRQPDAEDGRRAFLEVTQSGHDLIAAVGPHSAEVYRALESGFGTDKTRMLLALLDELAQVAATPPED